MMDSSGDSSDLSFNRERLAKLDLTDKDDKRGRSSSDNDINSFTDHRDSEHGHRRDEHRGGSTRRDKPNETHRKMPTPPPSYREKRKQEAQKIICDAERAKAQLTRLSGKEFDTHYPEDDQIFYLGAHVDKALQNKIKKGEVDIDFAKLITKRKHKDEDKIDIVSRGGKSYVLPTLDKATAVIGSYKKWEQAFRIFCSISRRHILIELHNFSNMVISYVLQPIPLLGKMYMTTINYLDN